MKLLVPLLLVALALGCYEADAAACPAFVLDSVGFLFDPKPVYRQKLAKYDAPPEAVEAKLQVKECTDEIDKGKRVLIAAVLTKIVKECAL
ncbi:lipophilin AL precursor [Oryctolagus cuniculus]|uniref:Lipophilin AL n=1 Tax=Oryctolagus cuniculus TaxID=9986 RepID=Q9GK67_RABIT|nr:lipophilin AL precursor [Oryctolagus cuniculus]AAG42802.1 lipophilin AL [Oryctolagus cuniculus]